MTGVELWLPADLAESSLAGVPEGSRRPSLGTQGSVHCIYGDIDFKAHSMILGGFQVNPLKIRVLRSCSENLVKF